MCHLSVFFFFSCDNRPLFIRYVELRNMLCFFFYYFFLLLLLSSSSSSLEAIRLIHPSCWLFLSACESWPETHGDRRTLSSTPKLWTWRTSYSTCRWSSSSLSPQRLVQGFDASCPTFSPPGPAGNLGKAVTDVLCRMMTSRVSYIDFINPTGIPSPYTYEIDTHWRRGFFSVRQAPIRRDQTHVGMCETFERVRNACIQHGYLQSKDICQHRR